MRRKSLKFSAVLIASALVWSPFYAVAQTSETGGQVSFNNGFAGGEEGLACGG